MLPPLDPDPAPTPPERPQAADCCGRGCDPCIFDLYEEDLARYELALRDWRLRHPDSSCQETR